MSKINVCKTKVHYDTEFEAQRGAYRAEDRWGSEFEPYKCGPHWHITHKDPSKRIGTGHLYAKCPNCNMIMKRSKVKKHKCERKTK